MDVFEELELYFEVEDVEDEEELVFVVKVVEDDFVVKDVVEPRKSTWLM